MLVVSHDRYFLNQVADRLIVVADGRARVVEGDYETYQRLLQREAAAARRESGPGSGRRDGRPRDGSTETPGQRRKRQFPYRKPADVEREIAEREAELTGLEQALARPETYRDAETARLAQDAVRRA